MTIEQLPPDQHETLEDVSRRREIEARRQGIAADARAAIAAFRAGMLKPQSAEDLILELHRSLEDPELGCLLAKAWS